MRSLALVLLATSACTKPVAIDQDAGGGPLGVVVPDFSCPGPGCEDGADVGELLVGAAKRSIVPNEYELVNTAYLDARNSETCDPGTPLLGSGHKHRLELSDAQLAAVQVDAPLTVNSETTLAHSHEVVVSRDAQGALHAALSATNDHSHELQVGPFLEPVTVHVLWTAAERQRRCGEMRRRFSDFPSTDCGEDGLCEGDEGWPGADEGENDGKPDWFRDCGADRICPGNIPEEGALANNGLDDDFDGVIDDGPYPGPDFGEGNLKYDGLWQAGFGSNIPSVAVHDPIWARCFAALRGDTSVVICSVDLVGFFWDDVQRVRALVADAMGSSAPDHILVSATHTHEAPDSMGQWGPITNDNDVMPRISGVNPRHMELVRAQLAAAVAEAMTNAQPARLKMVTTRSGTEQLLRDSRDPQVLDDTVTLMQAINKSDNSSIVTVYNWGNHPEILSDVNNQISSDFAHDLRLTLENGLDGTDGRPTIAGLGGVAIYLQGTVGGLMTPLGLDLDDFEGNVTKRRSFAAAQVMGEKLAIIGLQALASESAETVEEGALSVRRKQMDIPIFNTQFHVALLFGLFDRGVHHYDPAELINAGDEFSARNLPHARSEVNRITIGPMAFLSVPGELFPELAVVDSLKEPFPYTPEGRPIIGEDNENPPAIDEGPAGPYLRELTFGARHTMIVGLGNDELGYLIPDYDFKTNEAAPYFEEAPGDHYEETNSTGPAITGMVLGALRGMERWLRQ